MCDPPAACTAHQQPSAGREGKEHRSARAQAAADRGARIHAVGTSLTVATRAAMRGVVAATAAQGEDEQQHPLAGREGKEHRSARAPP